MANLYEEQAIGAHPDVSRSVIDYKAPLGTALHRIMEEDASAEDDMDRIINDVFAKYQKGDGFYDKQFTNMYDIANLVKNMAGVFRKSHHSYEWTNGRHGNDYELQLESNRIDPGYRLIGQIDCVRKDGRVIDLKTGAPDNMKLHQEQLAAYHILLKHQDRESPLIADVVKVERPRYLNSNRPISTARYEVNLEQHVRKIPMLVKKTGDMIADFSSWKEDFTKIPANIHCRACFHCKLRNTSACPETRTTEI